MVARCSRNCVEIVLQARRGPFMGTLGRRAVRLGGTDDNVDCARARRVVCEHNESGDGERLHVRPCAGCLMSFNDVVALCHERTREVVSIIMFGVR
jgi:hypothetical protein